MTRHDQYLFLKYGRSKMGKTRQGEGGYSGEIDETETGESYEVVDPFGHRTYLLA